MAAVITPGGRVGDDSTFGRPGGPGLFRIKGKKLPRYVRIVAHGLMKKGRAADTSQAIRMAIGVLKNWARGGDHVHPQVQAAAAAAIAEWEGDKAEAHAS